MGERGILYWTRLPLSHGSGEAELGHARVIEVDGTERDINGGDPITRGEAVRLAEVGEYTLDAEP